jgi:TadE-like protein
VVEFALVVPILLLILAGAVDLGRAFYAFVAVENAAKEGALYGARHPLCDSGASCPDPRNVRWVVENEATNLRDRSGQSLLTTQVACRTPAGALVQPMNDCVNGDIYVVSVSHSFRLVTPILGDLFSSNLTLSATSEATVIEDAFDPTGLEVLVWVDKTGADNAGAISTSCTGADPPTSPGYFYAPCQDSLNRFNYLQFQEGDSVRYKVRVRNTGNVDLSSLAYTFSINGSVISKPSSCSLPGSLALNSQPKTCTFTRVVTAAKPLGGVADYLVEVAAQGKAAGLPTGPTFGSGTVKVIPPPLLVVTLRAARYRLGGDGNGIGGSAFYGGGDLTLDRTTDQSRDVTLRKPTGWLKVSVSNQGGPARNFGLVVTREGSSISLPSECPVPTSLAASGSPGDSFTCILPSTLSATRDYDFHAIATATNATYGSGDPNVTISTKTCTNGALVVPNLVDALTPPDGSRKTLGQARSLWSAAGFTGSFTTVPSNAPSGTRVLTQSVDAYTCQATGKSVQVDTR